MEDAGKPITYKPAALMKVWVLGFAGKVDGLHSIRASSSCSTPIARRTNQKVQLVSGFRAPMFSAAQLSYHTRGMAADIRNPGMTPLMVRDLVASMGVKGVGYYPVSRFVHIDVRDEKYWTDHGAPRADEGPSHAEE